MEYELVHATDSDREFLLNLRMQTMAKHMEASGLYLSKSDHLERVNYRYNCFYLVKQFGKTIGCLKYESAQNTLNIVQIQISPEFQNKGHGYRLLKHIIDNSASKTISLTVLKVNPAYHLYTRLGFTTVGKDEHEYHMQLNR